MKPIALVSTFFLIVFNLKSQTTEVSFSPYIFECPIKTEPSNATKDKHPPSKPRAQQKKTTFIINNKEELSAFSQCDSTYVFDFDKYILLGTAGKLDIGCGNLPITFKVFRDDVQKKYLANIYKGPIGNCRLGGTYRKFIMIEKPISGYTVEIQTFSQFNDSDEWMLVEEK